MASKLTLNLNNTNFSTLISKIKDLSSIDDVVKMKIDREEILIYSMLSNDVSVLALKTYQLKTSDYIIDFDRDETYDFIITSASKFVKNLSLFSSDTPIKIQFLSVPLPDEEDVLHVRSAQFTSGKLKISCIGGEMHKIRGVTADSLSNRLNPKNSKWKFGISRNDFADVKKLCSINNEEKILNINVNDGKVTMSETSKWELEIDTIQSGNRNLIFGKKYLSNINIDGDSINFLIFETFILVKDSDWNLMLSFEQNFDDAE